jgi:PAS domain S-box-containing protein
MIARPRSLRLLLAATSVATAVVPALLVGSATVLYGERYARSQVAARSVQGAQTVAAQAAQLAEAQLVQLQDTGLDAEIATPRGPEALEAILSRQVRANRALQALLLLDGERRVAHFFPRVDGLAGLDLSAEPAVREAAATLRPAWSSGTRTPGSSGPAVLLVLPMKTWFLVAALDPLVIEAAIDQAGTAPGSQVSLLGQDGTLIAHPEARLVRDRVNLGALPPVRAARAGAPGAAEYRFQERTWLGSARPVPGTGWLALVGEPAEAAYGPARRLRQLLFLVYGVAALAAGGLGLAIGRRIARPIEALSAGTRQVAQGQYQLDLAGRTTGAYLEVEELARSLQAMADAVRAREQELAVSERNYRALSGTPLVGVARTTLAGEVLFCNLALARTLGFEAPEELVGRNLGRFLVDPDQRRRIVEEVQRRGRAPNVEVAIRARGGAERTILVNVAPEGGVLTSVAIDITDRKLADADRARLELELFHAQKLEAVGRLAGGVAHDFNNLLTAIIGFAGMLQDELPHGDSRREATAGILAAAGRATHLTRSLLAYSRKQVLAPRPVDLCDVIRGVQALLGRVIGEDVELTVEVPPRGLVALADPGQLEQVLVNLCTNSRDAMPGGGQMRISAEALSAERAAALRLPGAGRQIRVRVADTGQGMSAEVLGKAFEPFFTTKAAGKGTGLGLAIVYGIIRQHGGQVAVESEPGRGTTVTIDLPAHDGPAQREQPTSPARAPRGRETVLLAEDEPLVREVMRRTLAGAGYAVIEAADGEEAVARFGEAPGRIDLCLLDVVMPRRNGKDAADAIARLRPGVPILLASGYAADVLEDRGHPPGGAEFIAKPIAPGELLERVRRLLDRGPAARA